MKYVLFSFLALFFLSGCASLRITGTSEIYEGTGHGYRGAITVQVHMSGGIITDIVILYSREDPFVGEAAMEELIDLVIMYNTTDLDAVSGATGTSRGFLEAVENAILGR